MLNNTNYESTICLIQTFVEILFDEKVSELFRILSKLWV